MIVGVGLDLCEISRMEKLIQDGRFLARFFTESEQAYILGRGKTAAASMAGIFAAKEAFAKALGVGLTADIRGISVQHDAYGAPYYSLEGEYAQLAADKRIDSFFLSITHDGGVAAAVCVAERSG